MVDHPLDQSDPAIRQIAGLAMQHLQAGQFAEAQALYQKILMAVPNQSDALHFLGVIALQEGRSEDAVSLIERAISNNPDDINALNNLGQAYESLERLDDAMAVYRKALQRVPGHEGALVNLGNALAAKGEFSEAVQCYQGALEVNSNDPEIYSNLGDVFLEQGHWDDAITWYREALSLEPNFLDVLISLGYALQKQGRLDDAISNFQDALSLNPNHLGAHINLANTLLEQGQLDVAIASYQDVLRLDPNHFGAHNNLGNAFKTLGNLDKAVTCYEKALVLKPDYAEAHANLGNAFVYLGNIDEAVACYQKALAIEPDHAEAHTNLARIKKHTEYDDDIRAMETSYAKPTISDEQKMHLAFGLGKAFEDLQDWDKAFGFFSDANRIKRGSYSYSIDDDEKAFHKLEEAFDASLFAKHSGAGCSDETPIFILGMPRSGTTLVEQILASHSQVFGAGEMATLGQTAFSYFAKEKGADFQRLGSEYIKAIRKHAPDIPFITDKMPENFKYIGLIKLMLPNAKVIHCRRDPVDTCLSIYKNYFTGKQEFAYDLGELGRFYNLYYGLMEHWGSVLPGFIQDIHYEDLVAEQAGQTRTLLEYCGLEWDDACLEFHKSDRQVSTASAEQVRRPIYKDSVQLSKHYEKPLTPLLEILR